MSRIPERKFKLALAEICFAVMLLLYLGLWHIGIFDKVRETYIGYTNAPDFMKTIVGVELFAYVAIVIAPICWFAALERRFEHHRKVLFLITKF